MAKDKSVTVTDMAVLPFVPSAPKKRGRPSTGKARTNAQRQRDFRFGLETVVAEQDSDCWSVKVCLFVLSSPRYPAGSPLHRAAWLRIGELNNYR